ncbi:peptide deformylase [Pontivivens insulae]|uniref:Peptide deformylase-like n=1 Tax=Pontivivens insulae TaxID=1639689 RepID=A0A2R8ACH3_9RHOB|nr:peptide deformylase [Pontivivens insulae]RED13845.1 peptide deformylase [Pontivivens insulae]SPF29919.1 Peptide deformylase 1 [Pontivivens insulae]
MTRPFLPWPDTRLRRAVPEVEIVDDGVRAVWDEMLAAMYTMPGVGLAGPQIGEMRQLAVVDCSTKGDEPVRMANPRVLHASVKLRAHEEASPNLPGISAMIERPRAVTVAFLNERGEEEERDFVGLWATSVQHQIDHLNGKVFVDRLKPVKRRMLLAKYEKLRRRG